MPDEMRTSVFVRGARVARSAAVAGLALAAVTATAPIAPDAGRAGAQAPGATLAARVAAATAPSVEFRYPSRPGTCGDGRSYLRVGGSTYMGSWDDRIAARECVPGPVRVVVRRSGGEVADVRAYVGPDASPDERVADLGTVSAAEGSAYLLGLAEGGSGRVVDKAIAPALLGDGVVAWPALLRIARRDVAAGARGRGHHEALFWLGRYAAAKAAYGSDDPFAGDGHEDDDETDVKSHAVFALSQLPRGEGVEPLIQVARTNRVPAVRAKALFWLGESGDPRAVELFGELLGGR